MNNSFKSNVTLCRSQIGDLLIKKKNIVIIDFYLTL